MEEHVAQEGELREEPSGQEINAPTFTATQTGKEQQCNVNQNNELVISIIFQHIDMIIFFVAVHDPEQMPRRPSQRRTRSMVHEHMETQTIEGHDARNTMSKDDYDTRIVNSFNVKKHKSKKKQMYKFMTCIWMFINVASMKHCLYELPHYGSMFICCMLSIGTN